VFDNHLLMSTDTQNVQV